MTSPDSTAHMAVRHSRLLEICAQPQRKAPHNHRFRSQEIKNSVRKMIVAASALGLFASVPAVAQDSDAGQGERASAVFVMTNSAERNVVIAFTRTAEGSLQESGRFGTGGRGSGGNTDPLGSQGSLTLSQDRPLLFAVNAGSGEVSVFRVLGATLALVDRGSSGGSEPNAVAQHGGLVYVLNASGSSGVGVLF